MRRAPPPLLGEERMGQRHLEHAHKPAEEDRGQHVERDRGQGYLEPGVALEQPDRRGHARPVALEMTIVVGR